MALPPTGPVHRFCRAVDRLSRWTGIVLGFTILFVSAAVVYEVAMRGLLDRPTVWTNETTIYLSAVTYLLAGGYALLHRGHVRIDLVYERLSPRLRRGLDAFTFLFFVIYVGTLVWVGGELASTSFLQGEATGTPWNPPIWPVKAAIPLAGALLLLQGIANLLRDLGFAAAEAPE